MNSIPEANWWKDKDGVKRIVIEELDIPTTQQNTELLGVIKRELQLDLLKPELLLPDIRQHSADIGGTGLTPVAEIDESSYHMSLDSNEKS